MTIACAVSWVYRQVSALPKVAPFCPLLPVPSLPGIGHDPRCIPDVRAPGPGKTQIKKEGIGTQRRQALDLVPSAALWLHEKNKPPSAQAAVCQGFCHVQTPCNSLMIQRTSWDTIPMGNGCQAEKGEGREHQLDEEEDCLHECLEDPRGGQLVDHFCEQSSTIEDGEGQGAYPAPL
jgi:hypothetical protein